MRSLWICPFLIAVHQFSGSFAISNYAETIFRKSGSTVDPCVSPIVMASVQMFGTYAASQLMDRLGRKVLLLVSMVGCLLAQVVAGTYSYLEMNDYDIGRIDFDFCRFQFDRNIASPVCHDGRSDSAKSKLEICSI